MSKRPPPSPEVNASYSPLGQELATVARAVSFTGAWMVIGQLLNLLAVVIIARLAGAAVLGSVAVGLAVLALTQIIATAGTDRGVLKYVSYYLGRRDRKSLVTTLAYAAGVSVVFSALVITLYYAVGRDYVDVVFNDVLGARYVVTVFVLTTPLAALVLLLSNALTALQQPQHAQFAQGILRPVLQVGVFLLLAVWLSNLNSLTFATAATYPAGALFLAAMYWRRLGSSDIAPERSDVARTGLTLSKFLSFSLPLAMIPALNYAGHQLDTAIVAHFLNSSDTGVYAVGRRVSAITGLPILVFGGVVTATTSKLHAQARDRSIRELYSLATKWISFLGSIAFLILFVAAEDILILFGQEFQEGVDVLRILVLGQLVSAAVGPSGGTLLMLDKERLVLLNSVIAAISGVSLAVWLTPIFGLTGAAAAIAITLALLNVISALQLILLTPVQPMTPDVLLKRIAYTLTGLVLCSLAGAHLQVGLARILMIGLIAVASLGTGLATLEGVTSEERRLFRALSRGALDNLRRRNR